MFASLLLTTALSLAPAPLLLSSSASETPPPVTLDSKGLVKRSFLPFTLEAFIDELRNKRDFVVFSFKAGTPESLMQEPALSIIQQDPSIARMNIYKLDLETQAEDAAKLYIEKPATLLIFKGGKEVSRTVRIIDPAELSKLLLPQLEQPQTGQMQFEE